MSDRNPDDEALNWAGDERLEARPLQHSAPAAVADATPAQQGAAALVAVGILGGVAVIETLGWIRSVLSATLEATVDRGSGDAVGTAAFAVNLLGRTAAVVAPLLWFGLATWRIRSPRRRFPWLVLGALLLVPWPAVLGLL